MKFDNKKVFIDFLSRHPEKGTAFEDININHPYDLTFKDYDTLTSIILNFEAYDNFILFMHMHTHELFLGSFNHGEHASRCRAAIFSNPATLKKWYENWAWEMWK